MLLIGLVCVVLAVPTSVLPLLPFGALLVGMGHGLAWKGSLAVVNLVAPDAQKADVLSGFYVATYVGTGLPVIGVGFLAGGIGLFPAVIVFACAIALAGGVLIVILVSKRSVVHQVTVRQDEM